MLLFIPLAAAADLPADPTGQAFEPCAEAQRRGALAQPAACWREVGARYEQAGQPAQQFDALLRLADAYQSLGQTRQALQALTSAQPLAAQSGTERQAAVAGALGRVYRLTGAAGQAGQQLQLSLRLARQSGAASLEAAALNDLGNLAEDRRQPREAREYYRQSLALARRSGPPTLAAKVAVNAARAALQAQDDKEAATLLDVALQQTRTLPDSHDKAYSLLAVGELDQRLSDPVQARAIFEQAAAIAERLNDQRALAYALGYLGESYAAERQYPPALSYTRRAVFAAQQAQAPEILYRWQWRLGRLLQSQGDANGALSAYRQAVASVQTVRPDLTLSYASRSLSFRDEIGDVFFELADLLLQRAARTAAAEQKQAYLLAARDTVEALKATELKDYFQDDCVVALQSRITPLDRLPAGTAALYPILLPDRLELLLSLPDGMRQFTVPVGRAPLTQTAQALRRYLEKRTTQEYLPYARQLYDWLLAPIEATLQGRQVTTLIIVPDGPLRAIPLTALHDGQGFVVERYAVATTPGLALTDLRPPQRQGARLLLNGLTEPTQGFPALEHVADELQGIQAVYGGKVLRNENFLVAAVQRELAATPYAIVHIASHGQFTGEARNSFVLAFDDKLTLDRLEQFMGLSQYRQQPVELLTLSACQTAAGDERAALGLAGVAVKAGARSAVATLWSVDDEASALLVEEFYQRLRQPQMSKAQALQQAQRRLLADPRYRHPGYWSPFLLIGNWL